MYQIKRIENRIREDLQLCDKDGKPVLVLPVDINVDTMANEIQRSFERLGIEQNRLREDPKNTEAYGKAVIGFFTVIFGEEGCKKLLAFFEGNYIELLLAVYPFLSDEILPKVREASAARQQQMQAALKRVKAQTARPKSFWR